MNKHESVVVFICHVFDSIAHTLSFFLSKFHRYLILSQKATLDRSGYEKFSVQIYVLWKSFEKHFSLSLACHCCFGAHPESYQTLWHVTYFPLQHFCSYANRLLDIQIRTVTPPNEHTVTEAAISTIIYYEMNMS